MTSPLPQIQDLSLSKIAALFQFFKNKIIFLKFTSSTFAFSKAAEGAKEK